MTGRGYAAMRRRRVVRRRLGGLGERVVAVGGDACDWATGRHVLARIGARDAVVDVVGVPSALPVASGALTGVAIALPLDAAQVPSLEEALRVVAPGGRVLAVGELTAGWPEFEEAVRGAGGEVLARAPLGPLPAHTSLPRMLWRLAAATDRLRARLVRSGRVEAIAVIARPGGAETQLPDAREIVAGMFLPRAWTRRRRER